MSLYSVIEVLWGCYEGAIWGCYQGVMDRSVMGVLLGSYGELLGYYGGAEWDIIGVIWVLWVVMEMLCVSCRRHGAGVMVVLWGCHGVL